MSNARSSLPRYGLLAVFLLMAALMLSGCFIQPDRTLDPLAVDPTTPVPAPVATTAANTPAPTAPPAATHDAGTSWESWDSIGTQSGTQPVAGTTAGPAATPRPASSWQTSTTDYNAGYPVLKLGSSGSDVYDMQERLKELGYYNSALDGKFAAGTQDAVVAFQSAHGLTADGIAGRATQDKLYSSTAKAAQLSASAATASTVSGSTLLKSGSQGTAVRKLQVRLSELGYYNGGADGVFGTTTETAVKSFQRNNKLSADGQAGEQTQKKLYSDSASMAPRPVATADPNAVRSLKIGMEGNDVYSVQQRLIELRYLSGVADGVFGPETLAALTAFQQNNNLTPDGVAGASTVKKLNGNAKAASNKPTATATPKPGTYAALREGDAGEYVYSLQERLYDLGYYTGRIDGRFGAGTTTAVSTFQAANNLTVDGIAGSNTQKKMFSSSAKVNPGVQATPSAATPTPTPATQVSYTVLQEGSSGEAVIRLQHYLLDLGYYYGRVDGVYGTTTTLAVRQFQYHNQLAEDGVAGPSTQALIYNGNAKALPTEAATPKPDTTLVLQEGVAHEAVRQMQMRLFQLQYLEETYVTGTFDRNTVEAVMTFQQRNGLQSDGIAGPATLVLLYDVTAQALD